MEDSVRHLDSATLYVTEDLGRRWPVTPYTATVGVSTVSALAFERQLEMVRNSQHQASQGRVARKPRGLLRSEPKIVLLEHEWGDYTPTRRV